MKIISKFVYFRTGSITTLKAILEAIMCFGACILQIDKIHQYDLLYYVIWPIHLCTSIFFTAVAELNIKNSFLTVSCFFKMWQYLWAHAIFHMVRWFPPSNRIKMWVKTVVFFFFTYTAKTCPLWSSKITMESIHQEHLAVMDISTAMNFFINWK